MYLKDVIRACVFYLIYIFSVVSVYGRTHRNLKTLILKIKTNSEKVTQGVSTQLHIIN
jgi:hypothetical protein